MLLCEASFLLNFLEGIGGKGRRENEGSFFLGSCCLGIPGIFSQENGIPEKIRWLVGLLKVESDMDSEEEIEERDVVRRDLFGRDLGCALVNFVEAI